MNRFGFNCIKMCDITRANFEEKYAEIERAIKGSSFIGKPKKIWARQLLFCLLL